MPAPAGAAWTLNRRNVADPWAASFDFQMFGPTGHLDNDGSGGDGIAFLIQNSSMGTSALGLGSGGMGFMGIDDSLAVMFDSYQNNAYYGDPSGHYIGVNTRGTFANVPHHFCTDNMLTSDASQGTDLPGVNCNSNPALGLSGPLNFDDGAVHNVTMLYTPGQLAIYLDKAIALTVAVNLAQSLNLDNGTDAFLGFTAGTRFAYQNQDILDFSFATVPEPPSSVLTLIGSALLALVAWKCKPRSAQNSKNI